MARTLRVVSLTSCQGARVELDSLSLAVEPGKLTVVLGEAGAGKSALIRAIAGLRRLRSGAVEVDGADIADLAAYRRGFGVVLHPDQLFPHLTVAGNVAFPLRMRGLRGEAAQRRVANTLDLLGLASRAGLMQADIGADTRQRALLARATVFEPEILLLDEPCAGLHASERASFLQALRRMHDLLGATTLMTSSLGADALEVADRIAILSGGMLEQHGGAAELFERPRTDKVAAWLGEVNRLPGTVRGIEEEVAVVQLACGPLVRAELGRTLQLGDACVVALRPNRIAIAAVPAHEMGEDAVQATLLESRFLGESWRLRVLIGSGAELLVVRPAVSGWRGAGAGAPVSVAWQPQHALALRVA